MQLLFFINRQLTHPFCPVHTQPKQPYKLTDQHSREFKEGGSNRTEPAAHQDKPHKTCGSKKQPSHVNSYYKRSDSDNHNYSLFILQDSLFISFDPVPEARTAVCSIRDSRII